MICRAIQGDDETDRKDNTRSEQLSSGVKKSIMTTRAYPVVAASPVSTRFLVATSRFCRLWRSGVYGSKI
jgi:hypothetical protein